MRSTPSRMLGGESAVIGRWWPRRPARKTSERQHRPAATDPTRRWRARAIATGLATAALIGASASPAFADYRYYGSSSYDSYTHGGQVHQSGRINWFVDKPNWHTVATYDSEIAKGSSIRLQQPGCMHFRVRDVFATTTVSWPPSAGLTVDSDGWWMVCGPTGTSRWVAGSTATGRTLLRTCVDIAYSRYATYPKVDTNSQCYWAPY